MPERSSTTLTMEAIGPDTQLVSIFGPPEYNNFNEPVPFSNQPRCLIGFTASFLVSASFRCALVLVAVR